MIAHVLATAQAIIQSGFVVFACLIAMMAVEIAFKRRFIRPPAD